MALNSPVQTTTGPGGQQFQYQLQGLPTAQNTSTSTSLTGDAAKQNLSAAPDLTSLTDLINTLNRNAQTSANAARIPNNPALEQASSGNIANLLAGQIPADVINNLAQTAAERGVAMGSPGSDNSNAGLLRALGLTSLDLQQLGQQNLSAADARNPVAPIFNPGSMLLTPGQLGQLNNAAGFLGLDWYKALHPNVGGGGYGGGGGGGMPTQSGGPSTPNSSWWNSLFPSQPTLYGGGGGGFANTGTTTTTPGGSSYTNTNQDFSQYFGDPYSGGVSTPPPNTVTTDTGSYYDPFSQYYGGGSTSDVPANTVTTDYSSTYDPFAQYYGGDFGGY